MPISKSLMKPVLPEVGKIKIGGKGEVRKSRKGTEFRLPVKFDHFLITHNRRSAEGDFIANRDIMEQLGPKPRELDIMLLYDDVDLNFPNSLSWYEGKTRRCFGDGERAQRLDPDTGELTEIECPCEHLESVNGKPPLCKPSGRLSVILPSVRGVGGSFVFRTHGWNSVSSIQHSLEFIQTLTGGILAGIPLKMKLHTKTGEYTDADGKSRATDVHYVSIEYAGTPEDLNRRALEVAQRRSGSQIETARLLALAQQRVKALKAGDLDAEETEADIVEEYYPETQPGYVEEVVEADPVTRHRRTNPVTGTERLDTKPPVYGEKTSKSGQVYAWSGAEWVPEDQFDDKRQDAEPLEDGDVSMADMAKEAAKIQGYKDLMARIRMNYPMVQEKFLGTLEKLLVNTDKKKGDLARLIKAFAWLLQDEDNTQWYQIEQWSEHGDLVISNDDQLASASIKVLRIVYGNAKAALTDELDRLEQTPVDGEIVDPDGSDGPDKAFDSQMADAIDNVARNKLTADDNAAIGAYLDGNLPDAAARELLQRLLKIQKKG